MVRLVVVGAGMAGLATALFAARRGHEVVLVDRDPGPPGGAAGGAEWDRQGVTQAHFAHGWPALSARVLRQEAPDVLDALAAVGVGTTDTRFGPDHEDDRVLTSRRSVYEAVLRDHVLREPTVEFVHGRVAGLVVSADRHVVGVRLDDGDTVDGLVVEAGGRRSSVHRWLADAGLPALEVEDHPCGLYYASRHFRLRPGEDVPVNDAVYEAHPCINLFTFVGDDRTFSVAAAMSAVDPLRRRLRDPDAYGRLLDASPTMTDWVARAAPLGPVHVMSGLSNRRRRLVVDDRVTAPGLVLVGDSALYTNPTLGQGVSLAFAMAQRLADDLERVDVDVTEVTREHEAWVDRELQPRLRHQVAADARMRRQLEAGVRGAGFLPPDDDAGRHRRRLFAAAAVDPWFGRRLALVMNLLLPPSALDDAEVRRRLDRVVTDEPSNGAADELPAGAFPRTQVEALLAGG